MTIQKTLSILIAVLVLAGTAFLIYTSPKKVEKDPATLAGLVTLTGTYECLPHTNTDGPQTTECAFGFKTDDGDHYAVNFGQSANAAEQFKSNAHITAEGFIALKETLNTDQWNKYNMKGIFTITKVLTDTNGDGANAPRGTKLDINAVCKSALAYMTFPDNRAVDVFMDECREGKHPEVIERFIKEMGGGDGRAI
jgi:hypothetical protein